MLILSVYPLPTAHFSPKQDNGQIISPFSVLAVNIVSAYSGCFLFPLLSAPAFLNWFTKLSKPLLKKAFHKTPVLTGKNSRDYLRGELSNGSTLICIFREARGFLYFADTASNNSDVPFEEFRLKTKPDPYLCNKEADRNALVIRQTSSLTCLETVDLSDSHLILSTKNSLLHLFSQFIVMLFILLPVT